MYKKSRIWLMGLALLFATACSKNDTDPVGNGGFPGPAGTNGAAGSTPMGGMGGTVTSGVGGSTPLGSGGSAGSMPISGSGGVTAGTGGATAGSGGTEAGSGGAVAGSGGTEAGSGGAVAGSGGTEAGSGGDSDGGTVSAIRAVIVKAAGPPPGENPENHPDAITSATVAGYNTHVFVDVLAAKLNALGVDTRVFHHFECPELNCAMEGGDVADIVVLASPTNTSAMLNQIVALLPYLDNLAPPPGVCSGLTSCGNGPAVDGFVQQMTAMGLNTIPGVSLQADARLGGSVVTEAEMNAVLETFANDLVAALP